VAVVPLPANVPLAPEPGAVNVTLAFGTGLLLASNTVATSELPNALLIWALWPPPEVAVMLPAAPALFVNANGALPGTPGTLALTE
jgi:hypothetical protein